MKPEVAVNQQPEAREECYNLTARERVVVAKIKEHIKGAELDSVLFDAFTDHVDYLSAGCVRSKSITVNDPQPPLSIEIEYGLINETIRKRRNGKTGYDSAYNKTRKLCHELEKAVRFDESGKRILQVAVEDHRNMYSRDVYILQAIKEDVIAPKG